MDWSAFQEKARNATPDQPLPAKRYWIGVLRHDQSPDDPNLIEENFVWMKAHGKVSMQTAEAQYVGQYASRGQDIDVELQFSSAITPASMVKNLDHFGDHLIALRAVPKQTRRPLQPINRQVQVEVTPSPLSPPAKPRLRTEEAKLPPPKREPVTPKRAPVTPKRETVTPKREPTSAHSRHIPDFTSSRQSLPVPGPFVRAVSSPSPRGAYNDSRSMPSVVPQPLLRGTSLASNNTASAVQSEPNSAGHRPTTSPSPNAEENESFTSPSVTAAPAMKPDPATLYQESESQPTMDAFDPDQVFKKDPTPEVPETVEAKAIDASIRRLHDNQNPSPELLEAGVTQAVKVLDCLRNTFVQHASTSAEAGTWIQSIDKLKQQSERKRTVVGVVGNTGAGKSSVINAMLDEERLVPTNCMRACTAVVTEMSWNTSEDPNSKYRAEIDFIAAADWEKELGTLLNDFITESGTFSRETADPNSDAGIAWAKFQAVYPKKTKEMLANSSVAELMRDRSVVNILGTTKRLNEARPAPFYRGLQRYVDSKEKSTGKKKDKDKDKPANEMEYWPLIKVVKIYTKSPALSTGACIVDLPGVHDSNAARAAVAEGYMKQCTGLWIVAPINRAVDDKAAKRLLGDSFKRQLKYDGGFSAVTFICSKTDDISVTEAIGSLGLEDQVAELEDEQATYEKMKDDLEKEITELRDSKDVYKLAYDGADEERETWEDLKDELNDGKTVYAPVSCDRKRKSRKEQKSSRKRSKSDEFDEDFIVSDEDSSASDTESELDAEGVRSPRKPLTIEDIETKLEELKDTKKNARRQRAELDVKIKEIAPKMKKLQSQLAEVEGQLHAICIAGRNGYSKGAIQVDFAAGIKELDQENAAEEDEENFNPDVDLRDYDEVAESLPVFCVSSRAYQKMCGRLEKDRPVPGFRTLEETEIPQLQAHCKKLTEAGRIQSCRSFLLSLCQQLNTFSFWASDDGTGLQLSDEDKKKQVTYLTKRLDELEKGLEKATKSCINTMKKEMHDQIFEKYPEVIEEAIQAAPGTARGWGAHRAEGGLFWATYKAIVRRDGSYTSASAGFRDFNAELMEPITKRLATGWERSFQSRLPKAMEAYIRDSSKLLHRFHETVEERARQNGVGLASLALLKGQIYNYEQLFNNLYQELLTAMTELQRDANRDFTPTIVAIMHTVYDICSEERGSGSFMRMKSAMAEHVDRERYRMFKEATSTVEHHLDAMCRTLLEQMENRADDIFMLMRRDYMQVLGGVNVNQNAVMSKEERAMRAEIRTLLQGIDEQFRRAIDGEPDEPTVEEDVDGAKQEHACTQDDDLDDGHSSAGGSASPPAASGDLAQPECAGESIVGAEQETAAIDHDMEDVPTNGSTNALNNADASETDKQNEAKREVLPSNDDDIEENEAKRESIDPNDGDMNMDEEL